MLFRLMRICSTEDLFIQRYKELCIETLVQRGYERKLISSQLAKLKFNIPGEKYIEKRKFALLKVIKKAENSRVIAPIDYNPHMPNINKILRKHHNAMIQKNSDLKESFADPPMAAFRQPINLRRLLCKSKNVPKQNKIKSI